MGQDVYPLNMTRAVSCRITHCSWQPLFEETFLSPPSGPHLLLLSLLFYKTLDKELDCNDKIYGDENILDIWWRDRGRYWKQIVALSPRLLRGDGPGAGGWVSARRGVYGF